MQQHLILRDQATTCQNEEMYTAIKQEENPAGIIATYYVFPSKPCLHCMWKTRVCDFMDLDLHVQK